MFGSGLRIKITNTKVHLENTQLFQDIPGEGISTLEYSIKASFVASHAIRTDKALRAIESDTSPLLSIHKAVNFTLV
jgi:hypothetical protein